MKVKIKRSDEAKQFSLPKYQTAGAAGFDIVCIEESVVEPGTTVLLATGLYFEVPEGYELQLRLRSSIALKTTLIMPNSPATVDSDYRGEVRVMVRNTGEATVVIDKGMRVAQGVINKVELPELIEVDELSSTVRGEGGFGSTGK